MIFIKILRELKKKAGLLFVLLLLILSVIAAVYLAWRPE